jgi:hypothetical protein
MTFSRIAPHNGNTCQVDIESLFADNGASTTTCYASQTNIIQSVISNLKNSSILILLVMSITLLHLPTPQAAESNCRIGKGYEWRTGLLTGFVVEEWITAAVCETAASPMQSPSAMNSTLSVVCLPAVVVFFLLPAALPVAVISRDTNAPQYFVIHIYGSSSSSSTRAPILYSPAEFAIAIKTLNAIANSNKMAIRQPANATETNLQP